MGYSIGLIKIELTDSSSVQRWCGWDGLRPVGSPQLHWAQNRIIVRLVYLRFAGLLFLVILERLFAFTTIVCCVVALAH